MSDKMVDIDFSRLDRPGIDSVMFAIRKLLEECEGTQYHLKPQTFGKIVKGININDGSNGLKKVEKLSYKRQLARVLKYWNEYDLRGEWQVQESNGKCFKLVFRRNGL
ncbi:MAG: hypothetical protein R6V50_07635 [Thermoplasmatota archaeon]